MSRRHPAGRLACVAVVVVVVAAAAAPLWLTSVCVCLCVCAAFGAVLQGSLFGMAGVLPASYTTPIMSGQGMAGSFAAFAMICAIASLPHNLTINHVWNVNVSSMSQKQLVYS